MKIINVKDAPFFAKGDGKTNDREALQNAIDLAAKEAGSTVFLPGNSVYLTTGIVLRSGVTLMFDEGAVLEQMSGNKGYVKPQGDTYVPYTPAPGHNFSEKIKWSHNWYRNYPFIYVPEGSRNFKITGKGVIKMSNDDDPEKLIKICPIGFYRCSDFEISDIHITNYHGYAMMPFTCSNGLIKNIIIDKWSYGNGDGICLMNCRNIRITGCKMFTGDDSIYVFSSYRDPRKGEWWSSDEPQSSENIEIDHNDLKSNHCKAFGMILWGMGCEDKEKVEVRNVYVHDNHIETLGIWLWDPYTDKKGNPPVTSVTFENNIIDGIEANFFETHISDLKGFKSMSSLENGEFNDGKCFWILKKNSEPDSVSINREKKDVDYSFATLKHFDKGYCALYQGLYFTAGHEILFKADVKADTKGCRLFVRDALTEEYVSSLGFDNPQWEQKFLRFSVPRDGNYQIGIESGEAAAGECSIKFAALANYETGCGYQNIIFDNGKMIYKINDNLFKRKAD